MNAELATRNFNAALRKIARAALAGPRSAFRVPTSALHPRSGVTLLELLVVIIIIVTITAATIPAVLPALANRRVREASRIVNVFIAGARSRAMQTGRPVGVMFERFAGLPDGAMTLSYCEVPPPYAGDFTDSRATVQSNQVTALASVSSSSNTDSGWQGIVRKGDLVKFNYQGRLYQIVDGKDANNDGFLDGLPWMISPVVPGDPLPGSQPVTVPYQVFRAPVKLASGGVQLPEGAIVDLAYSGFDWPAPKNSSGMLDPERPTKTWTFQPNPKVANDVSTVAITFNPGGSVDKVWCHNYEAFTATTAWGPQVPVTPIHLLIGRRELLPAPATLPAYDPNKIQLNWHDPANLWVSINPQTGLVATAENAVPSNPGGSVDQLMLDVRRFARESHAMGGR